MKYLMPPHLNPNPKCKVGLSQDLAIERLAVGEDSCMTLVSLWDRFDIRQLILMSTFTCKIHVQQGDGGIRVDGYF